MKKRLFITVLLCIVIMSLGGCKSNNSESSSSKSSDGIPVTIDDFKLVGGDFTKSETQVEEGELDLTFCFKNDSDEKIGYMRYYFKFKGSDIEYSASGNASDKGKTSNLVGGIKLNNLKSMSKSDLKDMYDNMIPTKLEYAVFVDDTTYNVITYDYKTKSYSKELHSRK